MLSGVFAERLRCALGLSGKKQKELAQHIGVGRNIVSYYCSGVRKPTITQLALIAEFLGVSSDYLLGLSATPTCNSKTAEKYYQDYCKKTEQLKNVARLIESILDEENADATP